MRRATPRADVVRDPLLNALTAERALAVLRETRENEL